jgi:hypothetical protein
MLSQTQMFLSRKTLKKLGILAIPNKLEKNFSIYNTSFEDEISRDVHAQVKRKHEEILEKAKLKQ